VLVCPPVELVRQSRRTDSETERHACGDGCGCCKRSHPALPQRRDVRPFALSLLQDARSKLRRRRGPLGCVRERAGRLGERRELTAAPLAAREMRLVLPRLFRAEGVERVRGRQVVKVGFHVLSPLGSASSSRKRASPANILLL